MKKYRKVEKDCQYRCVVSIYDNSVEDAEEAVQVGYYIGRVYTDLSACKDEYEKLKHVLGIGFITYIIEYKRADDLDWDLYRG